MDRHFSTSMIPRGMESYAAWQTRVFTGYCSLGVKPSSMTQGAVLYAFKGDALVNNAVRPASICMLNFPHRGNVVGLEPEDAALLEHEPPAPPGLDVLTCTKVQVRLLKIYDVCTHLSHV